MRPRTQYTESHKGTAVPEELFEESTMGSVTFEKRPIYPDRPALSGGDDLFGKRLSGNSVEREQADNMTEGL